MSEQSEIVLVIDDATWHIWTDNKQWKNANDEHKQAAWKYWTDHKERLSSEYDHKADARRYHHENKERLNAQRKKRYEEHIEEERTRAKQYYEQNKDKINEARRQNESKKERNHQYYKDHKENINAARCVKLVCECGTEYSKSYKARHLQSTKHFALLSLQAETQTQ